MSNKSKNKGKGFERQVAALLASAWGGHWQRVPNSGAMVGGVNSKLLERVDAKFARLMSGDIIVPEEFGGLEVECKSRAAFNFMHLLRQEGNKELNAWIDQTWQHSPPLGLLMFKANNTPIFACHPYHFILPKTNVAFCMYTYRDLTYYIHEATPEWLTNVKDRVLSVLKCLRNSKSENAQDGLSNRGIVDEGNSVDEANLSG